MAALGSPDAGPQAHWLRSPERRGLLRAWPWRAGRRRGIVGALTGMRGMSEGAGWAREARIRGSFGRTMALFLVLAWEVKDATNKNTDS